MTLRPFISSALLAASLFSLTFFLARCGGGGGDSPAGGIVEGIVVDATNPSVVIENAYVYIPVSPLAAAGRPEQVIEDFSDSQGHYQLAGVPLDQDLPLIVEPTPQSSFDFARMELRVRALSVEPSSQEVAVVSPTVAQQITALGISPEAATVQIGGTRQFAGFVTGYPGELRCTWWVTGGIGTVSPTGLFTATREGTGAVHVGLADFEAQAPVTVFTAGTQGRIAFHSDRDGNGEIYSMNADGTGQANLSNNPAEDRWPSWSPDGSKIAFQSSRDGDLEIYVMNSDGTNQMNLTNNPASEEWHPAWSPDGSKIVFQSDRDGNNEVYLMNSDGSNPTNATNDPAWDAAPSWSPDGSKIAFTSDRDGNVDIYVMNSDGRNPTNLTNNPAGDTFPSWSPNGSKIAFESFRDGNFEIYLMNSDGSTQTRLTNNPASDSYASWSPDGSKIAFTSRRDGNQEIYVMNSDGTNQVNLTNNPADDARPRWSPF